MLQLPAGSAGISRLTVIVPHTKATGSEGECEQAAEKVDPYGSDFLGKKAAQIKENSIFSLQWLRFYDQSKIAQNFSAFPLSFKSVV